MQGLLEILPEYVLHWIVQRGTERHVKKTEPLLTEGEKNGSLYRIHFEALGINLFAECTRD